MSGLLILLLLLLIPGVVVLVRAAEAVNWRKNLVALRVTFPSGLTPEDVANWLGGVAAMTHAPRGTLLPMPPLVLEVVASHTGITHRLLVPKQLQASVLSSLQASLPGVRLEAIEPDSETAPTPRVQMAAQLYLAGRTRQLAVERGAATSSAVLASLQPLVAGEQIIWQWLLTGSGTPEPVTTPSSKDRGTAASNMPWWVDGQTILDSDEIRTARLKRREPLLHVAGRVLISTDNRARALSLFGRVWAPTRLLNVPGARMVRGIWPVFLVADWVRNRWVPLLSWPLLLNNHELAGLLAVPFGETALPGVEAGSARQLPPSMEMPTSGTVLADSTYPGTSRPIAIHRNDRLLHTWLTAPTGGGKSTLLANMVIQDMQAGDGLALIDAKGDLVTDVLNRVPPGREQDVIVLDAADLQQPVGFNVLRIGTGLDAELAVDHILHVLKEQWAAFWGPRTEMVLHAALLTLAETRAVDGSQFALTEVAELLTNNRFRAFVTSQSKVPASAMEFWAWFNALAVRERMQIISPVLNKLHAFTARTPLRLMLGQSQGLDLAAAMRDKKILLVPLDRGRIGAETAALVGSLMVAALWQTALGRTAIPQAQRRPWWLIIDEAQEIVRLPLAIADMLAEARGLHVGITLANQHLSQLPESVRHAVLSTVRSQVVFQTESEDARVLARSFEPHLNEQDLRTLPAYEVAMRLAVNGRTTRPVTGKTRPLPAPTSNAAELREASRQRYGVDRGTIQLALAQRRLPPTTATNSLGSQRRGTAS